MRENKFRLITLTLIACISVAMAMAAETQSSTWREQMLLSINELRKEVGVKPLKLCENLNSSAQSYSDAMKSGNFFSHTGKDGSSVKDRITKAGYRWSDKRISFAVGENIAAGQNSVTEVMNSWRNSSGHYKNIVNPAFTDVGMGRTFSKNSKYRSFWVQNFGKGGDCNRKK